MLAPLNEALARVLGGRRGLAALLLTIASILLILLPAAYLGVAFARQAGELVGRIQELTERHHISRLDDILRVPIFERQIERLSAYAPVGVKEVQAWLVESGQAMLRPLAAASGAILAGALGGAVQFFLMLFVLFFFLRDGAGMCRRALRLVPMDPGRKVMLVGHLAAVTRAVVVGMLLTAVAQGILLGIGFAIVGLPSPVVFGVLTAIASLAPLVGPALVWAPAVVVLFAQGRLGAGIFLALVHRARGHGGQRPQAARRLGSGPDLDPARLPRPDGRPVGLRLDRDGPRAGDRGPGDRAPALRRGVATRRGDAAVPDS